MCKMLAHERIIVALDVPETRQAINLVEQLHDYVGMFKIGLEFITTMLQEVIAPPIEADAMNNLKAIRRLFEVLDGKVFWDGKFDDIPNTVGKATVPLMNIGVHMFNVHASAGREAVRTAVETAAKHREASRSEGKVFGVTVLTSLGQDDCFSIFGEWPDRKVGQLARILVEEGADGIICSPQEAEMLRKDDTFGRLQLATPGIRPEWAVAGDQKRITTPADAIKNGVDYLIVGRPITKPPAEIGGPAFAAQRIVQEIERALAERSE